MRDLNRRRRNFEEVIALQIAQELTRALGPVQPHMLAGKGGVIGRVFGDHLDANGITTEAAAARVLEYLPKFLADLNRKSAETNARLDAACRINKETAA